MRFDEIRDTLKQKIRTSMLEGAPAFVDGVQLDGKVEIKGAWTTYQQGCALLLAELFRMEDTPYHQSPELMEKLARSFQYFAGMADEDGKTPLTTAFGTWGVERNLPGWEFSGFVWLYRFHRDVLPPPTLKTLEELLAIMARTLTRELPSERLHNIPTWNAAALWSAGNEFNQDDWKTAAAGYLGRIADAQEDGGYWFEHTGPTTIYNLVYTHALGMHLFDGGEVDVGGALDRAGAFHSRFVYPDGSPVSVVDGRVLYHAERLTVLGLPGLLQAVAGLEYCRTLAGSEKPFAPPNGNGANFLPLVYRFLCEKPEMKVPDGKGPVPLADRTAVHSCGGFTVVLSGILGIDDNRWGYDRLQHVEVHHPRAGVVVGGGLSRGEEMAFLNCGGEYLAGKALLKDGGRMLRLEYPWGKAAISVASTEPLELLMEAESGGPLRMFLPLPREYVEADGAPSPAEGVSLIKGRGVSLSVEPPAELVFPVKPWFPYHKEEEAPETEWRYGLAWKGERDLSVRLRFDVEAT